jgi:hypothetical protein
MAQQNNKALYPENSMELGHSSLTNLLTRTYCKKNPQQTYINKLENYQDIQKNQFKF